MTQENNILRIDDQPKADLLDRTQALTRLCENIASKYDLGDCNAKSPEDIIQYCTNFEQAITNEDDRNQLNAALVGYYANKEALLNS